ncbi:type I-E CRISPR-associated protein Cse2/CasB [Bifidobacterium animalis]|uniref:type I-E CRISPR-associated protein Cse2/CasB n=1 Tax=Bifidobacterium animalis TaxID=28025 RepID=UPI0010DC8163|nr:type I-E CRISPR-associated protein Cse2/CasB [Bifidobacterium animalis]RYN06968.1 CRISPR-associated protein, Cse2 family [Bifidobacterium animalis subsp. lactis]
MPSPIRASAVGEYVEGKIGALQTGILADNSSARATLSRLRRDINGSSTNWMAIGNDIYSDWPVESLGNPDDDALAVKAVTTALGLYALHQQSQSYGVAQLRKDGEPSISFGRACRMIGRNNGANPQGEATNNGVTRRLSAAEAAPTFEGKVWFFRALIKLMRSDDNRIALNYGDFARDLYLIQQSGNANQVFQRWSCDFFYQPPTTQD